MTIKRLALIELPDGTPIDAPVLSIDFSKVQMAWPICHTDTTKLENTDLAQNVAFCIASDVIDTIRWWCLSIDVGIALANAYHPRKRKKLTLSALVKRAIFGV